MVNIRRYVKVHRCRFLSCSKTRTRTKKSHPRYIGLFGLSESSSEHSIVAYKNGSKIASRSASIISRSVSVISRSASIVSRSALIISRSVSIMSRSASIISRSTSIISRLVSIISMIIEVGSCEL